MTKVSGICTLMLLAALAACGRAPQNNEARLNGAVIPVGDASNVAAAPYEMAETTSAQPLHGALDELAGVKIGETLSALRARGLKLIKDEYPDPESSCAYAREKGKDSWDLMLDRDTVVRIDVGVPNVPTLAGVTVGMSESEAVRRLAGHVKVEPHPYDGPEGHYLVVHEPNAPLGLILETDGKTVQSYRIGRWQQVQWIEGCS